jgi:hypothetical protein
MRDARYEIREHNSNDEDEAANDQPRGRERERGLHEEEEEAAVLSKRRNTPSRSGQPDQQTNKRMPIPTLHTQFLLPVALLNYHY